MEKFLELKVDIDSLGKDYVNVEKALRKQTGYQGRISDYPKETDDGKSE